MNKELFKQLQTIENDFFEIDQENKRIKYELTFSNPKDIFDNNAITKIPVMSDDFFERMISAFEYAPKKYKIDLDIEFDDLDGFKEEELHDIFVKNLVLEGKRNARKTVSRNKTAFSLVVIGLVCLIALIMIQALWDGENIAKTIVTYVVDIASTITFWEALTILLVESKEKRDYGRNLINSFNSIRFKKKGQ